MKHYPVHVPSFEVDHTTLNAGLYLREDRWLSPLNHIKVWDLRFKAPRDKQYLAGQTMHTIEHLFAYKLRALLGKKYISFFTYGCTTGFGFISKGSLSEKKLRKALKEVIEHSVPIIDKDEIPCLTEKECGRPDYYTTSAATKALTDYLMFL